jgi:hypothetical protein
VVVALVVGAMLLFGARAITTRTAERAIEAQAAARASSATDRPGVDTTASAPTTAAAPARAPTATDGVPATGGSLPSTAPSTAPPPSLATSGSAMPPSSAPPPPDGVIHRGTMDPMQIREVVREAMPELRFCFEWQLQQHPELGGHVTMQYVIAADGTVQDASVLEDALHDETVTRCFTHVIGGLRFPPPEGGSVSVHYPFMLAGAPEARRPEGI